MCISIRCNLSGHTDKCTEYSTNCRDLFVTIENLNALEDSLITIKAALSIWQKFKKTQLFFYNYFLTLLLPLIQIIMWNFYSVSMVQSHIFTNINKLKKKWTSIAIHSNSLFKIKIDWINLTCLFEYLQIYSVSCIY